MRAFVLHQLESVINAYLRMDPESIERLAKLQGKTILLNIEDWNIKFYILPTHNGLELHRELNEKPCTTISGKLDALVHLGCAQGKNSALFKNRVDVEGDLQTGETIRDILAKVDIDWEEQLSKGIGDIGAHKVGNFMREIKEISQKTRQTLELNLKDFLHHETNSLPTRAQVNTFISDVSTIRNDVDRLEARLLLLQKQGSNSP